MWHKIVTGEVRISDLARATGSLAFMCRCIPVYFFGLNQLLSIHPAAAPCRLESENMAVAFEGRAASCEHRWSQLPACPIRTAAAGLTLYIHFIHKTSPTNTKWGTSTHCVLHGRIFFLGGGFKVNSCMNDTYSLNTSL